MKLTEINETTCQKVDNLEVRKMKLKNLELVEQECHFNILKEPDNGAYIKVCCSHQVWLLRLLRCDNFQLQEILISDGVGDDGYILQISGVMDKKGITIRQKRNRAYTKEQRQRMLEQLSKIRKR